MLNQTLIRSAESADAAAVVHIYNQGIERRNATFEIRLRTAADIATWFEQAQHPFLVAESADEILGWIAASTYRPRDCYQGIAEFSVYIATEQQGRGIGSQLMAAFIPACEQAGLWKIVSRIFIENTASRALCQKYGFREVGIYEKHGQLDGQWRDVVIVERLIPANLT